DVITLGFLLLAALGLSFGLGWWDGLAFTPPWAEFAQASPVLFWVLVAVIVLAVVGLVHRWARRWAARVVARRLERDTELAGASERVVSAFMRNVRSWRPFFVERPVGWTAGTRKRLDRILSDADTAIQRLNDRY